MKEEYFKEISSALCLPCHYDDLAPASASAPRTKHYKSCVKLIILSFLRPPKRQNIQFYTCFANFFDIVNFHNIDLLSVASNWLNTNFSKYQKTSVIQSKNHQCDPPLKLPFDQFLFIVPTFLHFFIFRILCDFGAKKIDWNSAKC